MKNLTIFNNVLNKKNEDFFVIAEIGQAHEGSLGQALSFIDAVADVGANAVKFQTHYANDESSKYDKFRVKVFPQDKTRKDYWKRMEFSLEEWKMIADRCIERGIVFLSSPFSIRAVDVLIDCDVQAWKIASGELYNYPMLDKILETNKPMLISTGMSGWNEIEEIYKYTLGRKRVMFQCTTEYPSQPKNIGLNNIDLYKSKFKDCVIGLSDHSGEIYPSMSAYMLGARVFEVHVTWSKYMFGPDTKASLTLTQLSDLVRYLNLQKILITSPVNKDNVRKKKNELVKLFGRGIYAKVNIKKNQIIKTEDLAYLKPEKGISASLYKAVINSVSKKDILAGEPIFPGDIE